MHDLVGRVHARVRTASGVHTNRDTGNSRERLFERVLHGAAFWLRLKAAEITTIVFDGEGEAH